MLVTRRMYGYMLIQLLVHYVTRVDVYSNHSGTLESTDDQTDIENVFGIFDSGTETEHEVNPVEEARHQHSNCNTIATGRHDPVNVSSVNMSIPFCDNSQCQVSRDMVCKCDRDCLVFGDCCFTVIQDMLGEDNNLTSVYEAVTRARQEHVISRSNYSFGCFEDVNNYVHYYMIDKCPSSSVDDHSNVTYEACSSNPAFSYKDLPVDQVVGGSYVTTFRNTYCAICNGIAVDDLQPWTVGVYCKKSDGVIISSDMSLDEIDAIPDCKITPKSMYKPRECVDDVVNFKTCPEYNIADDMYTVSSMLCPLYIYPVLTSPEEDKNKSSLTSVHRNIHCFACNNETIDSNTLSCYTDTTQKLNGDMPEMVDLQVIFDIGDNEATVSRLYCGLPDVCNGNEVFDCITKTCRTIYCPIGKVPQNGKCVDDPNKDFVRNTTAPVDTSPLWNNNNTRKLVLEIYFSSVGKSDSEINSSLAMTEHVLRGIVSNIGEDVVIRTSGTSKYQIIEYQQDQETFHLVDKVFQAVRDGSGNAVVNYRFFHVTLRNYYDKGNIQCMSGTLSVYDSGILMRNQNGIVTFDVIMSGLTVPEENAMWTLFYDHYHTNVLYQPIRLYTCLQDELGPDLDCAMVAFGLTEVVFEDEYITLSDLNIKLPEDEFVVYNNKVYVCSDTVTYYDAYVDVFEIRHTYRIMSVVTSSLSIAGVLIVIGVHLLKKPLRNGHGLNLTALSFSILIIHILLIVQVPDLPDVVCYIYAILLHVTFLIMFTWTNIIGIDMARIFLTDHIVSRSNPTKRFLMYIFVSISIPAVFIATCASLDSTNVIIRPAYAEHGTCWLTNSKGIITFFLAPVVLSLVLNIICFTITVVAIKRKTIQTKVASKGTSRSYVIVYLKLTIILGFTWIFGIVGSVWQQTWLSILNIILNGLQGLSILVCTFVNARNVRQFRETIKSTYTTTDKVTTVSEMTDGGIIDK